MLESLAGELVMMAEEQLQAQPPIIALADQDPSFAAWLATAVPTVLAAAWDQGEPPRLLVDLWQLHDRHDARLGAVIQEHGWPGRSLVGEDGADAAWVVAQHADRHQDARREWVPLLRRAVTDGEADPRHLARLVDRVTLLDERPQQYGTYASLNGTGEVVFDPPADGSLADVDARRGVLGLPPLRVDLVDSAGCAPYRWMRASPSYEWPRAAKPD